MIVAGRRDLRGATAYVGRPLLLLLGWDVAVVLAFELVHRWRTLGELPLSMLGSALAVFLVLRNNTAYARWWEARTLWGGIVNNSRTLARQARLFLPEDEAAPLVRTQVAFVHALRCHLRRQDPWPEIRPFLPAEAEAHLRATGPNVPNALLMLMAGRLHALLAAGEIDTIAAAAMDGTLRELANLQGGSERIKNTPLPRQYQVYPRLFAELFCVLLPLSMVTDLGWFTPLGSTAVGFVFLALEVVGKRLQDPFEDDPHDVPLTALCRTIEIDLRAGLGDAPLPGPLAPVDGVLW